MMNIPANFTCTTIDNTTNCHYVPTLGAWIVVGIFGVSVIAYIALKLWLHFSNK